MVVDSSVGVAAMGEVWDVADVGGVAGRVLCAAMAAARFAAARAAMRSRVEVGAGIISRWDVQVGRKVASQSKNTLRGAQAATARLDAGGRRSYAVR